MVIRWSPFLPGRDGVSSERSTCHRFHRSPRPACPIVSSCAFVFASKRTSNGDLGGELCARVKDLAGFEGHGSRRVILVGEPTRETRRAIYPSR